MAELNNYSARNTCDKINRRLVDYIKSEYLGKHDQLRKICSPELENYGALFNPISKHPLLIQFSKTV